MVREAEIEVFTDSNQHTLYLMIVAFMPANTCVSDNEKVKVNYSDTCLGDHWIFINDKVEITFGQLNTLQPTQMCCEEQ